MHTWLQNISVETGASLRGLAHALRGEEEGAPHRDHDRSAALVLPALLLGYVACMMVFSLFVRQWATLHHDSTEMAAWGAQTALGYSKHPPFGAWLAGRWFAVMPHTNWSFDLLAVLAAAFGLAGVWKLAGLYTDQAGQRFAMLPLMLTPAFTVWAFKYNANSILLLLWPWTAYYAMRMVETRALGSAVMAGLLAGLSMLGKYYSLVLFTTLGVALLLHPARIRVLASPAPYLAAIVALAVFAPHVWWLRENDASAIAYAVEKTQRDVTEARLTTLRSIGAGLLTLILPAVFGWLSFRADYPGLRARLKAGFADGSKRWILALAAGPLAFTILAHLLTNVRIGGDFLLPAFIAVPLAFVVLHGDRIPELAARRFTLGAAMVIGGMALLAPVIGVATFVTSRAPLLEPRRELALAATDIWRGATKLPLSRVAGSDKHATGIAFYSPDTPRYMDGGSDFAINRESYDIMRNGLLFVCPTGDAHCLAMAKKVMGEDGVQRVVYSGSHSVFGYSGPMYSYDLFLLPPQLTKSM